MCSPSERIVHPDSESHVPRTADEFVNCWKESSEYKALIQDIDHYAHEHPFNATDLGHFTLSRQEEKSKVQRSTSPYTLSYWGQVSLCLWRDFQRLKSDPSVSLAMLIGNFFESLIIASLFYDLSNKTSSFFSRGALLFMMVLLNAFSSLLEIIVLYEKRSIIEKHRRYALYHPSAEAISSILMDMPYKITNSILTNLVMYFMSNLRREPGAFFFLLLVSFSMMMGMSMFFRFFASLTKSIEQALAPSAIILLALVLYTGFTIPVKYMRGWASWIRWLNPVAYGFEAVMVNEFHGREFQCSSFVPSGPGYENVSSLEKVCSVVGAVPGSGVVQGTEYIRSSFGYENSHRWRNFGIIVALTVFLACCHLVTSELVSSRRSKGEVLVFRRGKALSSRGEKNMTDEEKQSSTMAQNSLTLTDEPGTISGVEKQVSIFHWQNVTYDIKIKKEPRRILDQVDGWIRPGTLTALMVCHHRFLAKGFSMKQTDKFNSGCLRCGKNYSSRRSSKPYDSGRRRR
jgi:ABC-type multidrug transport system permease subunit